MAGAISAEDVGGAVMGDGRRAAQRRASHKAAVENRLLYAKQNRPSMLYLSAGVLWWAV